MTTYAPHTPPHETSRVTSLPARAETLHSSWEVRGACSNRPPQWWDDEATHQLTEKARAACLKCPVFALCLAKAQETEGSFLSGRTNVKAGLTGRQRDWLHRQKRRYGTSGDAEEARLLALEATVSGRRVEEIAEREGVGGVTLRLAVELMPTPEPKPEPQKKPARGWVWRVTPREKVLASIDKVMEMRTAGASFDAVAAVVGVDRKTVRTTLAQYLAGQAVPGSMTQDEVRAALIEKVIQHRRRGLTWSQIDVAMGQSRRWTEQFVARWRATAVKCGEEVPPELAVSQKRLSEEQVLRIRERAAAGVEDAVQAKELSMRPRTIREIVCGLSFQEFGGPLRPVEAAA